MQLRGVLVSLFLLLVLLGCVGQQPAVAPAAAPVAAAPDRVAGYMNIQYGVSMNYAPGWKTDETDPNAIVVFKAPAPAGATLQPSVNLTMNDLAGQGRSLPDFVAVAQEQLGSLFPGFAVVESLPMTFADQAGHKLVFTMEGGDGQPVKLLQAYALKNDIGYVLTYTADASQFDAHLAQAQVVFDSFQITGSPKAN